jgi:hypothetical protein
MNTSMASDHKHHLVFTGHRVDMPDRATPRFPARIEEQVRQLITLAVQQELDRWGKHSLHGISSGANGGDILFLETCAALGVTADIYLALDQQEFCMASVADGGAAWARRFEQLCAHFPVHILAHESDPELNIWQRTNHWMLETALSQSGSSITVMALWDGDQGDGQGGTRDMVDRADAAGASIVKIDPTELL